MTWAPVLMLDPAPPPESWDSGSTTINFVCRVIFGILAILICLVPFKFLRRNGEFAAACMVAITTLLNIAGLVNVLIWHNNDMQSWWDGRGWCDIYVYVFGDPMSYAYTASVCATMRNLAAQVGKLRASPLTSNEKRARNLVHALIIFPYAVYLIPWVYLDSTNRYALISLRGCLAVYDGAWPEVIFMAVIPQLWTLFAVYYAAVTWIRFKQVERATSVLHTNNSAMSKRALRTKRRLFSMTMSILVPYFALQMTFLVYYLIAKTPLVAWSYSRYHNEQYNIIPAIPSWDANFLDTNWNWIPILAAIPVFWFFGLTKDAINTYREFCLTLGLGKFFHVLNKEYNPDSRKSSKEASHSWFAGVAHKIKSNSSSSSNNSGLSTKYHLTVGTLGSTFYPLKTGTVDGPQQCPVFALDHENGTKPLRKSPSIPESDRDHTIDDNGGPTPINAVERLTPVYLSEKDTPTEAESTPSPKAIEATCRTLPPRLASWHPAAPPTTEPHSFPHSALSGGTTLITSHDSSSANMSGNRVRTASRSAITLNKGE